jgi:hypothetical protein
MQCKVRYIFTVDSSYGSALYAAAISPGHCCCRWEGSLIRKGSSMLPWTAEEDAIIMRYRAAQDSKRILSQLGLIITRLSGRDMQAIRARYEELGQVSNSSKCWSREEDEQLQQAIADQPLASWADIAKSFPGRSRLECQARRIILLKMPDDFTPEVRRSI